MIHVSGKRWNTDHWYKWEKVHLLAPGTRGLLCNSFVDNNSVITVTPQPVNCVKCWKAAQMVAREQISNLSVAGIEKILEYTAQMRNGDIRE